MGYRECMKQLALLQLVRIFVVYSMMTGINLIDFGYRDGSIAYGRSNLFGWHIVGD